MAAGRLDATVLRGWAHAAVDDLISHTDEINGLNVFPVADADTGTNMLFTMRSAWSEAQGCASDVAEVAAALAAGALHGARGNSGVILSQILRGLAEVTAAAAARRGGTLPEVDGALFAAALRHAVDLVEAALDAKPGTIVSVLAAAADAADAAAPGLPEAVAAAADAAAIALDKTPRQLDVLADAGVVDAGGRGLLVLLDALVCTLTGRAARRRAYRPTAQPARAATCATPQFEVMYLLGGCGSGGVEALRRRLEGLGDSVVIAAGGGSGTPAQYSVHVHADDAGAAVEAGLAVGVPSRIQITALAGVTKARPHGSWSRERAVLAVVDGPGAVELFAGEGAHVLGPEPDGQVTAKQLLRGIVDTGAGQVIVLPNGYVAAEELVAGCTAAMGRGIDVVPVPAGSMVQGLAALAVHDSARHAVDDGYTMARAAAAARHGAVRVAAEKALTWAGACNPGDGLGISGDEVLVVGPDVTAAAAGLIDLLLLSGGELVTVLTGDEVDGAVGAEIGEALRDHVHQRHLGTELVTYHTGHRGDVLLIGVE
ncbi:dihydroxyacetone kinase [Mycolicibacterium doricum]|uniref:Dihydroxyacetone kinase n=1 Tax=Mycolicibacterium doricum TaxID=126673 RepID=A0A1X1TG60_9MYCO|nr:DAK2 domain-containing protein [Mycolicibacterium doricum]MCV7266736.1 DAK2 domain-containing protein [Mycolicibacterium doricum]ORV43526.1 dihydroxyacetone kinase [Mycolicibacterium doricum]BBZ07153.1 dihydroxyacetone kinase [Mycolicibacterium doricum]